MGTRAGPWLLPLPLPLPLLPQPRPLSSTVCQVLRDARARARVADRARILRLEDRVARREPLASRQPLWLSQRFYESRLLVLVVALAARDDAAAMRRAARDKSRERRTPLHVAATPRQPCTFCSFFSILALWLDAQRGGQLTQEQPRRSARRADERGVEHRAQRRDRGAVRTRRHGRALVSSSAHCGQSCHHQRPGTRVDSGVNTLPCPPVTPAENFL